MRQDHTQSATEKVRTLIERIDQLPSAPASAQRILTLAMQDAPDMGELIEAMEADPAVSMRVLRHANSVVFNRLEKVENIRQAVLYLGTDLVYNLASCVCVRESLLKSFECGDPAVRDIWRHSLACACAAKLLAERAYPQHVGVSFTAGLLHDCGKLVLLMAGGAAYQALLADEFLVGNALVRREQEKFSVDHCLVGKWLLEGWKLPDVFVDSTWMHHQGITALLGLEVSSPVSLIVAMADSLSHEALGTLPVRSRDAWPHKLAPQPGHFSSDDLSAVRRGIGRIFAERAGLFDLSEDAADFYCNALSRANRRLGRANLNLSARSRSLERDAQYLRNVTVTGVELSRSDSPQDILLVMARCMRDRFGAAEGVICLYDPAISVCTGHAWTAGEAVRPLSVTLVPGELPRTHDGSPLPAAILDNLAGIRTRGSTLLGPEGPPVLYRGGVVIVSLTESEDVLGELLYVPDGGRLQEEERSAVQLLAQLVTQEFRRLDLVTRCEIRSERLYEVMRSMQDLNDKLLKTQRLAAVGQLAAGAAHEINNPLAIISARAQLLAMRASDEAMKKGLRQMVDQIDRISAILGSLMDFARPASPSMQQITPREVMDRVLGLVEGGLSSQAITIERYYDPAVPEIKADSRQMEQVLLNLVLNAQHAMENGGGVIGVEISYAPASDTVTFTVSDTGVGIPPENIEKIFDPFFTTKGEGKGTGLGLSTAYGIIEAHKGRIEVESVPRKGTVFHVILPRDLTELARSPGVPTENRTPRQAVLVVDDEHHIREILREALESKGYAVEVAEDGDKALQLLREYRYRLMILDIRMPSRDGLALLREAGSFAQPAMPVVVLTGLASEQEMQEARKLGVVACLRKPFQVEELLAAVSSLLDTGIRP
jgi:signal transduction histidine kinase/HD-like signal output (HDOD) protein/CheY-like chemotaxis protein